MDLKLTLCECRWCGVTGGGCWGGCGTWFCPVTTTGRPSTIVTITLLSPLRRRSAEFLLRRCSSTTGLANTVLRSKFRGSFWFSAALVAGVWLFDRLRSLMTWDLRASGLLTGGGSSGCLCLYDCECAWWRCTDTVCPMPGGITFDRLLTAYAASTLFPATQDTSYIPTLPFPAALPYTSTYTTMFYQLILWHCNPFVLYSLRFPTKHRITCTLHGIVNFEEFVAYIWKSVRYECRTWSKENNFNRSDRLRRIFAWTLCDGV